MSVFGLDNSNVGGPDPAGVDTGASGDQSGTDWLSGFSDIFSSIGTTVGTVFRQVNTPTVLRPGQIPYATATGYNTSAAGISSITGLLSNPIVLLFGGVLLFLLLRKK